MGQKKTVTVVNVKTGREVTLSESGAKNLLAQVEMGGKPAYKLKGAKEASYASMTAAELKTLISERGIETEGTKKAELIEALEAADQLGNV